MNANAVSKSSVHLTQSSNTIVDGRMGSIKFHLRSHDFVTVMTEKPGSATDKNPSRRVNAITIPQKRKTQHKIITCRKEENDGDDFDLGELTDDF